MLIPKEREAKPRVGSLLRIEFEPGLIGYADCHPWPELGDLALERQLTTLADGTPVTNLLARSLALAKADGLARGEGRSLFESLEIPRSHFSAPYSASLGERELDQLAAQGFDIVKIKSGDARALAPLLNARKLRMRIDLNAKLSFAKADVFLRELRETSEGDLGWIDWLEDPCPFEPARWSLLREKHGVRLALDLASKDKQQANCYDVIVLKPAVQDPESVSVPLPIAVTSYLDHPVGQLGAAWVAASIAARGVGLETCGLVTHTVYEENEFSRQLGVQDTRLIPPGGTGIGFDAELAALSWKEVG